MTGRHAPRDEIARLKAVTPIARVIGETLQLKREGRLYVALCPFHGDRSPSFTIYPDHFHCFGCGAHGDVFAWLMRTRGMTFREAVEALGIAAVHFPTQRAPTPPVSPQSRARGIDDERRRCDLACRIWCEAVDPRGTPAEAYLHQRCVCLPEMPVIRFHPRCPRTGGALPAMVALMTDPTTWQPCGVHRTFLQSDGSGKAPVAKPKMMLGPAGVIRLAEPLSNGLGLAEGIETALSCMQIIGWRPVWAAGSSGMIERFPALPCTTLNIFADADNSGVGLAAARACAERWAKASQEVLIHLPPTGEDWNDAAQRLRA